MILDYSFVCKKVLQGYGYLTSGKNKIRLTILNFYGNQKSIGIPIYNPKNWTTLVADMLERNLA